MSLLYLNFQDYISLFDMQCTAKHNATVLLVYSYRYGPLLKVVNVESSVWTLVGLDDRQWSALKEKKWNKFMVEITFKPTYLYLYLEHWQWLPRLHNPDHHSFFCSTNLQFQFLENFCQLIRSLCPQVVGGASCHWLAARCRCGRSSFAKHKDKLNEEQELKSRNWNVS